MNRPRSQSRRNWPDYLIGRKKAKGVYYTWKHPKTGKEYGLGYSFQEAAAQAREANLSLLVAPTNKLTLSDRISETAGRTMSEWLDVFKDILWKRPSKKLGGTGRAESTKAKDLKMIADMREHFKDALISKITTIDCSDLLRKFQDKGHDRAAVNMRSYMVDCFGEAEAAGWIPRGTNPAEITKAQAPKTKRSRLSLEHFKKILDNSSGWSRISILLALVTGQRVSDVAVMSYENVSGGFLHVQQIKYGHRIKIPLKLELLGYSLESIIKQSRKVVGAKTIVHQTEKTARSQPGDALLDMTISRNFTALVREHLPKKWEGTPPTFHEIRALSKALHAENGVDTLMLLGHENEETGKIYSDPRGGWVEVKIPKSA